ncbi:hypothetical protein [Pleionea sp. CnH1-48]|uniref:hypothetical protein n=1 Tax=Pleionea sp. CnH1-48 TaxID=2954494 RepID=UPI002096F63D|nr:hypothetical protein [Pleionea sp. CnH1-48]MCO7223280.1 hypothetical protein [Pleionea sp. CnH1-48]
MTNRQWIDQFFYLDAEETKGLPYTLHPRGKFFCVSLSEVFDNPEHLIELFHRRLEAPREYGAYFNPIDYFRYQFLIFDQDKENELSFFHPVQNKRTPQNDWLYLHNLIHNQGVKIFHDGTQEKARFSLWDRLQCEAFVTDNELSLVTRQLKSSDNQAKVLFSIAKEFSSDYQSFPSFLSKLMEQDVTPALTKREIRFPLDEFVAEAKSSMEGAIIFAHHLNDVFLDKIKSACIHPQEVLSFHLTNNQVIDITRDQLLVQIHEKYPEYDYHPLLNDTILTSKEWSYSPPIVQEKKLSSFDFKTSVQSIAVEEIPYSDDLKKYIECFDICMEFQRYKMSEVIVDKLAATEQILKLLPCFKDHWDGEPSIREVNYDEFWDFGKSDRHRGLGYALYEPPYGTTDEEAISLFNDDLVNLIFSDQPKADWVIYESSTNNGYFINEWWDYLWVAYNTKRSEFVVLAATATD